MRKVLGMRWLCVVSVTIAALAAQTPRSTNTLKEKPVVVTVRLKGDAITPVTARHIEGAMRYAESVEAACLVILLDTPGGLVDSTREVVKSILRSRVPVIVYVSPAGARAASAGVFVAMAAHLAAMAPGTNIGAAHPVHIGGLPGRPPEPRRDRENQGGGPSSPIESKVVNDTTAWARSLAELRGRNVEWSERAVRESVSASATEAVREGIVDLMADDLGDLLQQLDGKQVRLSGGVTTLHTAAAEIRSREMWWGQRFLAAIANPNLALILVILGFYGILFELYTPGWGVPGTIGVICLIVGFFAMAVLPVNYVGLALIIIALALFVAEAFVTSFGLLTLGGVACLILGGLMLVNSPTGFLRVSMWLLVPIALATAAITAFLVRGIIKSSRIPALTGSESVTGTAATAEMDFSATGDFYSGIIRTHGELWKAFSPSPVMAGDALEVLSRDGLALLVRPVKRELAQQDSIRAKGRRDIA